MKLLKIRDDAHLEQCTLWLKKKIEKLEEEDINDDPLLTTAKKEEMMINVNLVNEEIYRYNEKILVAAHPELYPGLFKIYFPVVVPIVVETIPEPKPTSANWLDD
jgi:hypothetical protein